MLLVGELIHSDKIPPVTLSFIILNVIVYLDLVEYFYYPSMMSVCLSASSILYKRQWLRLLLSPFYHGDDFHLYYNMSSFSIKGRTLEKRFGSGYFLFLLIVFTISCGLVYVGIEYAAYTLLSSSRYSSSTSIFDSFLNHRNDAYLDACAIGFSGVIFALKVLTTHYLPSGTVYALNGTIPMPSKYVYWIELITISLISPNVSFAGHLAGIIVGLLYVYGPLRWLIDFMVPSMGQINFCIKLKLNDYLSSIKFFLFMLFCFSKMVS